MKNWPNYLAIFLLSILIGVGLGYWWAGSAYTKTYRMELERKDIIIDHYRQYWTPIRKGGK